MKTTTLANDIYIQGYGNITQRLKIECEPF